MKHPAWRRRIDWELFGAGLCFVSVIFGVGLMAWGLTHL